MECIRHRANTEDRPGILEDKNDPQVASLVGRIAPGELRDRAIAMLEDYLGGLSAEERAAHILYLTVGSTNMDYRSMTMNGEVQVTLAGLRALNGILDFVLLSGLCDWPESVEELDEHLPPPSGFKRRIASFVKIGL